jgi:hypothetical protein
MGDALREVHVGALRVGNRRALSPTFRLSLSLIRQDVGNSGSVLVVGHDRGIAEYADKVVVLEAGVPAGVSAGQRRGL